MNMVRESIFAKKAGRRLKELCRFVRSRAYEAGVLYWFLFSFWGLPF